MKHLCGHLVGHSTTAKCWRDEPLGDSVAIILRKVTCFSWVSIATNFISLSHCDYSKLKQDT